MDSDDILDTLRYLRDLALLIAILASALFGLVGFVFHIGRWLGAW